MKAFAILAVGLLVVAVATAEVFDESVDLSQLATAKKEYYSVRYVKKASKLIDRMRLLEELNPSMKDSGMSEQLIIDTRITQDSEDTYRVTYSGDPSGDPHFTFYRLMPDGKEKAVGSVAGIELVVPGNGCVYASGHTNNYFNEHHKYRLKDDELVEVMQPFLYSGLKTKTRKPIILYASTDYQEEVTRLPAGCPVEVLLGNLLGNDFLIKTPAGLVGWISPRGVDWLFNSDNELNDTPIEGLFYNGD